jgi:hypothetical protein
MIVLEGFLDVVIDRKKRDKKSDYLFIIKILY